MAGIIGPFFDTSVLVAGTVDFGTGSEASHAVMAAVAEGRLERPMTAWHCCLEYYSVTTRLPDEYRIEADEALVLLREEILHRFLVLDLPSTHRLPFLEEAARERLIGGRIYDAQIGEVARHAQADLIVTSNRRHFASLLRHGIRVLTPEELVQEAGFTAS